ISLAALGVEADQTTGTLTIKTDKQMQAEMAANPPTLTKENYDKIIATRNALASAYGVDSIEDLNNMIVTNSVDGNVMQAPVTVLQIILNQGGAQGTSQYNTADLLKNIKFQEEAINGFVVTYDPTTGVFDNVSGRDDFVIAMSNITVERPDGLQSKFEDITIDMTATTMYNNNGSSTLGATNGNPQGLGTGRRTGKMIGVSIQTDGMIYGTYDNGQTQLLGQIAVAEFANASGLEKQGDNLYSATLNSGEFDGTGVNITANGGYMNTGVLEMSNVDLSAEFTEMITTQRGFQANSRIITVSDTMLEELVNLKR
ncbi:MAG: flagellar hook-basal body complex protein, partial [Lachnospiraceae bacterium]|nr:flagellar hook-basal body complex protein [Lachnospiraceae bacterium]